MYNGDTSPYLGSCSQTTKRGEKMENEKVGFRLKREDMKIWKSFKNDVWGKYGKIDGVLGEEVIQAIRLYQSYLNSSIGSQQHTRTDKKRRLGNIMERMAIENFVELTEKDIRGLIRSIGGMKDKRTVDDYFRCLIDYGFVKHKVRSVYQIDKSRMPTAI
jgi:N-glycosylase/DNA lyase